MAARIFKRRRRKKKKREREEDEERNMEKGKTQPIESEYSSYQLVPSPVILPSDLAKR